MHDRTLAAALMIAGYAAIIGFTDNYVRVIAADAGLWQFHATRSAMGLAMLLPVALFVGMRLRPLRPGAVLARSLIHGMAMVIYFGALAFLPVAQVAAGLFTAPIFVLLISWLVYGRAIGWLRVLAVVTGFAGVVLVLGPSAMAGASVAAVLPVVAGALYATGNIATREWCAGESAGTILAGFFVVLGAAGLLGVAVLALWPLPVPDGPDGFVLRGAVVPDGTFLKWTFVQAAGSLVAVALMIRAYQVADAGRVSVFEYVILPASAFWSWYLWGETLALTAWVGMGLIVVAGVVIAMAGERVPVSRPQPAASGGGTG
jgi:drug/metabolite transporter (DMT)-like permease